MLPAPRRAALARAPLAGTPGAPACSTGAQTGRRRRPRSTSARAELERLLAGAAGPAEAEEEPPEEDRCDQGVRRLSRRARNHSSVRRSPSSSETSGRHPMRAPAARGIDAGPPLLARLGAGRACRPPGHPGGVGQDAVDRFTSVSTPVPTLSAPVVPPLRGEQVGAGHVARRRRSRGSGVPSPFTVQGFPVEEAPAKMATTPGLAVRVLPRPVDVAVAERGEVMPWVARHTPR